MAGIELATAYIQLVPSLRGAQRTIQRELGPIGQRAGQEFSNDFTRATSGVGESVGNDLEDGAGAESGGKNGKQFAKAFAAASGALIAAGIGKAILTGASQEVDTDRLAASLGASGAESARLGSIAGSLYAQAYGESFGEVTEAVGAVRGSFRGLGTGKELETVTRQALDFANIFQIDLPRATQVAETAVRSGFAKNATNALDLFTKGLQQVAPSLREPILDAVDEYGQFFNSVGIDGPRAMALLVAGADKGEFGIDKLGDAIKEFTILSSELDNPAYETLGLDAEKMASRIVGGGKGARTATNEIIDGLLAIKSPARQAQAAIQLFGSPFEDLNKTQVPELLSSLRSGEKGIGKFRGAIDKAGGTLNDNASTNLKSFKRQITQTFVETIGGKVLPALNTASAYLSKNFAPALKTAGGFVKTQVLPPVKQFADFLVRYSDIIVPVVAGIGAMVVAFKLYQFTIIAAVAITRAFAAAQVLLNIALSANPIGLIVLALIGLGAALVVAYKKSDTFRAFVDKLGNAIKTRVLPAIAAFGGFLREKVLPVVKQVIGIMGRLAAAYFRFAGAAVQTGVKVAAFGTSVAKTIARLVGDVSKKVAEIIKAVTSIPAKIRAVGSKFLEAGKAVMGKIFDGIKSGASGVAGFIADIAGSIKDAINDALHLPFKINGPGPLPDFTIPAFARGTRFAPGGVSLVGERGPELMEVPRGARIHTAAATRRMASPAASAGGGGLAALTITNWAEGKGFIRWIADEAVSSAGDLIGERMRAGVA